MRGWFDALLAVLLAPVCAACSRPLIHPTRGCVCDDCWRAIPSFDAPVCRRCGDPVSPTDRLHAQCCPPSGPASAVNRARAIGPHTGSLRAIIHALKYDGRRSVAPRLAALMREAASEVLADVEVAIPVPLHPSRRRERGFNQAGDLARHIGLPVGHALRRVRRTASQASLSAGQRRSNVEGAFDLVPAARALIGARVVLIDDVRTTGETLEACARVLKEAGVGDVSVVTAARVVPS